LNVPIVIFVPMRNRYFQPGSSSSFGVPVDSVRHDVVKVVLSNESIIV
jgi:hypothetical protein